MKRRQEIISSRCVEGEDIVNRFLFHGKRKYMACDHILPCPKAISHNVPNFTSCLLLDVAIVLA
jgi:hypothetical protein